MNNFRKDFLFLQCCYKQTADILRKEPCLVRTENLDNSLYTRTKTEVVHPTVYYCIHSASAGWVSTYTHWCELIFILCVQVVPIGAKFNVNIVYPLQLTLGAEYILNFNLNKIKDNDNTKSNAERFFFDPTGYKRNGLNIYAGLRFNF